MTDLVAADITNPHSGTTITTGRTSDVWGAHEVGLYRVALTASAPAGGFSFDPQTFGFQRIPGMVFIERVELVANVANARYQFLYDYVNKKIVPLDATDSFDDASGDDLHLTWLNILVIAE